MSADTDGWEVVSKDPASANGSTPVLTVYANGAGRINAPADRQLDQPDAVQFLCKADAGLLGITGADETVAELERYSVTREEGAGGDVRPSAALDSLGVDVDAIDETRKLSLTIEDGVLVADPSHLVTDDTADAASDRDLDATKAEGGESSDDEFVCREPDCHEAFDSERGRNIHEGRMHDDGEDDDAPVDNGRTDVPDPADAPSHETVRDCAEQVDTVQDLAELLDCSVDEARFHARDADVYEPLQDNPPRPGVDR